MGRRETAIARSAALLLFAMVAALLAAGCGGGEDSSSSAGGSQALTKAQYIKQANALCERERKDLSRDFTAYLAKSQGPGKSKEEVFAGVMKAVLLPVIEKQLKALETLEPPPADKQRIEAFVNAQRQGVEQMKQVTKLPEGPAGEKYLEPASRLAKAYGIKGCAQS